MNYYIIKPKRNPVDDRIIEGVQKMDKESQIVNALDECDIAILQKGWTRSKVCLSEQERQVKERQKPCKEAYLYADACKVQLS